MNLASVPTLDAATESGPRLRVPAPAGVGRYLILRHVGTGGMGDVYLAYDESLDRRVALKMLRPSPESEALVRREAHALARLSHPNVVQIFDVDQHEGQPFVAMEFVSGVPLSRWLSSEARAPEAILRMFIQCGRGLVAAHAAGLVHRDFKPANVMVGEDGRARVLDFGLAAGPAAPAASFLEGADLDAGTPQYMSPEQISAKPATAASDQFSFAVSLYRALYGQLPFAGEGREAMHANVLAGAVRAPPAAKAPDWIAPLLLRALSREATDRHGSLADLLAAIEGRLPRDPDLDPNTTRSARRQLLLIMLGVAAMVLVAIELRGGLELVTSRRLLAMPITIFTMTAASVLVLRKRLLANRFGVRMSSFVLIATATLIAHRLVALHSNQSAPQILAVDLLALGFESAIAGALLARWFAASSALLFLGAFVAILHPEWARIALIVGGSGALVIGLLDTRND